MKDECRTAGLRDSAAANSQQKAEKMQLTKNVRIATLRELQGQLEAIREYLKKDSMVLSIVHVRRDIDAACKTLARIIPGPPNLKEMKSHAS